MMLYNEDTLLYVASSNMYAKKTAGLEPQRRITEYTALVSL